MAIFWLGILVMPGLYRMACSYLLSNIFASGDARPYVLLILIHTFRWRTTIRSVPRFMGIINEFYEILFTYVMRFCSRTFLYRKDVRHEPLITYVLTPCSPTSTDCLNLFELITAIMNGEGEDEQGTDRDWVGNGCAFGL